MIARGSHWQRWKLGAVALGFLTCPPATGICQEKAAAAEGRQALPVYRLTPDGWGGAPIKDVAAVLESAAQELWKYFPSRKIEPFVVMRGRSGPIVHFQRNLRGEIVMNLDTQDTYWSQYAYQFAHEFCHILAGFDDDWKGNLWFEETLCETASLFVLRHMAETWKTRPPYPNWKGYSPALQKYVADVIKTREAIPLDGLADFYDKHADGLRANPGDRSVNGAMAVRMLDLFEREPESWEAVTWLNGSPSPQGETFQEYLLKWQRAVPQRHKAFIGKIMKEFGFEG